MKSLLAIFGVTITALLMDLNSQPQPINPNNFQTMVMQGKTVIQIDAAWNQANHYRWTPAMGVKYYEMSLDQYPELKNKFNVKSVPMILVFMNGKEVKRYEGGLTFRVTVPQSEILK